MQLSVRRKFVSAYLEIGGADEKPCLRPREQPGLNGIPDAVPESDKGLIDDPLLCFFKSLTTEEEIDLMGQTLRDV